VVQILPAANPSFGSQLISSIGGTIGDIIEGKAERRKKVEANRPHAQTFLNSLLKQQGADKAYDPENLFKASKRANEYIDKGYDPTQAVFAAYEDLIAGFPEKGTKVNQVLEGAQNAEQKKGSGTPVKDFFNKPATEVLAPVNKFLQSPLQMAAGAPLERLAQAVQPEQRLGKAREELQAKNANRPDDNVLQKIVGATGLPWLHKLFQGVDPTGILKRGEEALSERGLSILPKENQLSQISNKGAEATGEVLKDLLLFKGAGAAKTIPGKVGSAAALFGGEKAVKTAIGEGRAPSVGEIAGATAFGAAGELLGPVLRAATGFIRKIPQAYASIKNAVSGSKGAVTEQKIIQEAAKNLEARGVSVIKAAEGDSKALNEIQKESTKVAKTFERAEKFNRKEIEKIRGEKAEKLVQSPLEEYYAPKKEVVHRPETLAKEAERIKPLQAKIKQSERSLLNLQYDILKAEERLKDGAAELGESGVKRVQALIDHNKLQHQKHLNEIRAAQFEIKYGKPPATTEQIQVQISKSFDEIRAGIKDPTAAKVQKLEKALEQNKEAVETAQRLTDRGELPGPKVFDEFIKIKQEYVKAYGDLIEELGTFIRENKGDKALASQVENARRIKGLVEQSRERAKASIVNQTDKRKAMKTLEGASGALWKNLLKDVRTDVDAFKKQWVKVNSVMNPAEKRTLEAVQKTGVAKKDYKTPASTPKPLEAGAEAKAGAQKKKADQEFKDTIGSFGEKFQGGKSTEKDIVKAENAMQKYLKRLNGIPGKLLKGGAIGALQSIFEEMTGIKIPVGILGAAIPGNLYGRGAGIGGAAIGHRYTTKLFDYIEEQKLRKLRNTQEFQKYRKELEQRYSAARANRIVKAATQSK
jgi:hypothetical protein